MDSQIKCEDTTSTTTLSTTSGKPEQAENVSPKARRYKLNDLRNLTFQLVEDGPVLDLETCSAADFNAFLTEIADVEDVDLNVWPLEVRRDFVNDLAEFCLTNGYDFPLTELDPPIVNVKDKIAS